MSALRRRAGVVRHQIQGLVVFLLALGLTSGALAALHLATPTPARWLEILVLTLANAVATLMRFLLLRIWVFRRRSRGGGPRRGSVITAALPR